MKEEDLKKVIDLKEQLDYERELLKFANSCYVDLKVNLEEKSESGFIRNMDYLLGDSVIKELKAKVITNIEKRINNLLDELEKL